MEEAGDGAAGLFDGAAGLLTWLMDGTGVAEVLHPEGAHRLEDFREERRGGVSVHVDAVHRFILLHGDSDSRCGGRLEWEAGVTRSYRLI